MYNLNTLRSILLFYYTFCNTFHPNYENFGSGAKTSRQLQAISKSWTITLKKVCDRYGKVNVVQMEAISA
jgi:hypothetical protein